MKSVGTACRGQNSQGDPSDNRISSSVCEYVGVQIYPWGPGSDDGKPLQREPAKYTRGRRSGAAQTVRRKAEKGQIVETTKIKEEYEKRVGHKIGSGQIDRVLKRQGWRKVMPRSRHPKKAGEEERESSKELTILSKK